MNEPAIRVNSLKMAREALCLAEGAILNIHGRSPRVEIIASMIADIDRQRPIGQDGKHGNRHTKTCGCDDADFKEKE